MSDYEKMNHINCLRSIRGLFQFEVDETNASDVLEMLRRRHWVGKWGGKYDPPSELSKSETGFCPIFDGNCHMWCLDCPLY